MKKIILLVAILGLFVFDHARAQQDVSAQQVQVDYKGQSPIDSDLDGLTDQAEMQNYKTDPKNPDTDGDGYYDGTEVLAGSDPLDVNSIPGMPQPQNTVTQSQTETPWAWYIARATGLVGFALLYLSIFLGLTIRVGFLRKMFAPLYAMQAHCWIAFQATLFALIHGISLMFDKFLKFSFIDVFVPFASSYKTNLLALGIIGLYLMIIITASSYAKRFMSHALWRILHFANIILYAFVIIHAYYLGTDMQNAVVRNIFVFANIFLIMLMLVNMIARIMDGIEARKISSSQNDSTDIVK